MVHVTPLHFQPSELQAILVAFCYRDIYEAQDLEATDYILLPENSLHSCDSTEKSVQHHSPGSVNKTIWGGTSQGKCGWCSVTDRGEALQH